MRRIPGYASRLVVATRTWSKTNWLLSFTLVTLMVVVLALLAHWSTPESVLRTGGLVLQLLGLASIGRGLHDLRERFSAPSPWMLLVSTTRDVWSALLGRGQSTQVDLGRAHGGLKGPKAHADASTRPPPGAPPDVQIDALWRVVDDLGTRNAELRGAIRLAERRQGQEISQEREARKAAEKEIREDLAFLSVGGLYLEAMGLVCLIVGVILGTIPEEIVRFWMYML